MSENECILCDEHSYISRKKVCELLDVHYNTVLTWVEKGILPEYIMASKKMRYKVSDINALTQPVQRSK